MQDDGRLIEYAPAKINLTLDILGKRSDGFHELESLVAFARDATDVISVDLSKPVSVTVDGPFADVIQGDNLVQTALETLRLAAPKLRLGAVTLTKRLPVAAGIGGGSADAAALLRVIRRANPELAETVDWMAIAQSLGADVPVCFADQATWMTGIGEQLQCIDDLPALACVLVNALGPVPENKTAAVFHNLAARPLSAAPVDASRSRKPTRFSSASELLAYVSASSNDLTKPAMTVMPYLTDVLSALSADPDCRDARISGAGPTAYALFEDDTVATAVAHRIATAHPTWWVQASRIS